MFWEIVLIVLSALCLIVGLLGAVVPVLPGVPLSYVGLLLLHFTDKVQFSTPFLLIWAAIVVVIQVLDNVLPAWLTKKSGGSRAGVWGSIFGLIVGFFFGPIGIICGPFLGAIIGELLAGKEFEQALKSGGASFLGFIGSTILKLVASGMMIFYFFKALL